MPIRYSMIPKGILYIFFNDSICLRYTWYSVDLLIVQWLTGSWVCGAARYIRSKSDWGKAQRESPPSTRTWLVLVYRTNLAELSSSVMKTCVLYCLFTTVLGMQVISHVIHHYAILIYFWYYKVIITWYELCHGYCYDLTIGTYIRKDNNGHKNAKFYQ